MTTHWNTGEKSIGPVLRCIMYHSCGGKRSHIYEHNLQVT